MRSPTYHSAQIHGLVPSVSPVVLFKSNHVAVAEPLYNHDHFGLRDGDKGGCASTTAQIPALFFFDFAPFSMTARIRIFLSTV